MRLSICARLSVLLLGFLLCANVAHAQFTVRGTVTDEQTGETLVGVNVFEEASSRGTVTDVNGAYELELPGDEALLQFSIVGYLAKEVPVTSGSENVDVTLRQDVADLGEVVVTGLATSVERSNLANAVAAVSAEELTGTTEPETIDNALYGKLPGVNIVSQGGAPGGGTNVQLRGISTLGAGSSQPLYIIDGVYVNNSAIPTGRSTVDGAGSGTGGGGQDDVSNRLADLNPEEIKSVEVLKGPSAAAIYGARANAGVIIITTKRGAAGTTRVNFSQDVGFNSALNLLGVASWDEAKIDSVYRNNPDRAALEKQRLADARANGKIFDYEEEVYGNRGLITSTQISVSGGSDDTQFYVSGGIKSEDGIIENTGFDRRSLRANIDHRLSGRVKVGSSSNYINSDTRRGFTGNQNGTGASVGYNIAFVPTYAQLFPDEQGNYPVNPYFADNPLAIIEESENTQEVNRFIQSASLDVNLLTQDAYSLELAVDGGLDYLSSSSLVYLPEFLQHQQADTNPGDLIRGQESHLNANLQAFLVFNAQAGPEGSPFNLTTQAGVTRLDEEQERLLTRGQGLAPLQTNVQQAQVQSVFDQRELRVTDLGFAAQQEVNWADRVIATVGGRFDRSTLNLQQDAFYFFPKASLALNVANFDFWKTDAVSLLKLRGAYGETGGLPTFGNTFTVLNGVNIGDGLGSTIATRGVDPDLKPERARELEFGFDLALLDGRIGFEATYYNKTIDDIILDLQPASSTGISAIATNAGALRNRGLELSLNAGLVRRANFAWNTNLLFWQNDSEVTRLDIPAFTTGGFGANLGTYYIAEGFSPTTIVGTPAIEDGATPFTVYGDAQPDFQMAFGNRLTLFRDFELSFLFQWSQGGENINLSQLLTDSGGTTPDYNEDSDGDGVPNGRDREGEGAGIFVQDASYVKIRELGLYYSLPERLLGGAFGGVLRTARVGISGNNLLLFSDYDSYDPEVSNFGTQPVAQSVEVTPFPSARRLLFTLQLGY